ncbi:Nif11-like leader peptide family natural product precursor [Terrisporobacter vanillatitrophus]
MNEKLVKILEEARNNQLIKEKFIETRDAEDPMEEFCNVATSMGYDMTVGDLFAMGEEYSSNLLKSCNGGAVYPMDEWSDWYEDFFTSLN